MHFKELENKEQIKLKANRKKEIMTLTAEINEIKNRKTIENVNEAKGFFFEKVNTYVKPTKTREERR